MKTKNYAQNIVILYCSNKAINYPNFKRLLWGHIGTDLSTTERYQCYVLFTVKLCDWLCIGRLYWESSIHMSVCTLDQGCIRSRCCRLLIFDFVVHVFFFDALTGLFSTMKNRIINLNILHTSNMYKQQIDGPKSLFNTRSE